MHVRTLTSKYGFAVTIPFAVAAIATGCGSRSPLSTPDAGPHSESDAESGPTLDIPRRPPTDLCTPVDDACGASESCGNGLDEDCDGSVDENCDCTPGRVQPCFRGPPGRRGIGACVDGEQACTSAGEWGACLGGIAPTDAVCSGRDDYCDGCGAEPDCILACPAPDDPRLPEGRPFEPYPLRGRDFLGESIEVREWLWRVEAGPCDAISPRLEAFVLRDRRNEDTQFVPMLSGDYRVTLRVTLEDGTVHECSWVVRVAGQGLRVELCYPESEHEDLDLYLHAPNDQRPWNLGHDVFTQPPWVCSALNCKAAPSPFGDLTTVDWGYGPSPLEECEGGLRGDSWRDVGHCRNPRLDLDNNQFEASGMPENINLDNPRDGETVRVMVNNFSGGAVRPLVQVYCGGVHTASLGGPEDPVPGFTGGASDGSLGAMWRVADITMQVNEAGETTGCSVAAVRGSVRGFDVTQNDGRF